MYSNGFSGEVECFGRKSQKKNVFYDYEHEDLFLDWVDDHSGLRIYIPKNKVFLYLCIQLLQERYICRYFTRTAKMLMQLAQLLYAIEKS